jgi:hypothetical protein
MLGQKRKNQALPASCQSIKRLKEAAILALVHEEGTPTIWQSHPHMQLIDKHTHDLVAPFSKFMDKEVETQRSH